MVAVRKGLRVGSGAIAGRSLSGPSRLLACRLPFAPSEREGLVLAVIIVHVGQTLSLVEILAR